MHQVHQDPHVVEHLHPLGDHVDWYLHEKQYSLLHYTKNDSHGKFPVKTGT